MLLVHFCLSGWSICFCLLPMDDHHWFHDHWCGHSRSFFDSRKLTVAIQQRHYSRVAKGLEQQEQG